MPQHPAGSRWSRLARSPVGAATLATVTGVALGVAFSVAIATFMPEPGTPRWRVLATQQVVYWGTWGLLVVPGWLVMVRTASAGTARRWLWLCGLAVGGWLAHAGLLYTLSALWTPGGSPRSYLEYALRAWYADSLVLVAILSAMIALRHARRARDDAQRTATLTLQLSQARLRTLEAQLQPHFLFNALHSIAMLARVNDGERIMKLTAGLGDLLRAMLESADDPETTLRDELALVERYLAIERIRFQDRLNTTIDAASDTLDARVPRFILQPLVENAMRHGLAPKVGSGCLRLRSERVNGALVVTVSDDGIGTPSAVMSGAVPSGAHGLRLTRERLVARYGTNASLQLEPGPGGGTAAIVRLPWRTEASVPPESSLASGSAS